MVRSGRRPDGVNGDLHVPVGAVLEAYRARQARCELAVYLALGRAGADRAPGDEVRDVLGRDHVEILGAGGERKLVDLEQDAACEPQALVDAETVVEAWIIDQSLPADRRAWLLEIHAHDDDQLIVVMHVYFEKPRT